MALEWSLSPSSLCMSETQQGNNDDGKVASFTPKDNEEQNNVVVIEKTCNGMWGEWVVCLIWVLIIFSDW